MTDQNKPSWQYVPPTSVTAGEAVDATKYMRGGPPRRCACSSEQPQSSSESPVSVAENSAPVSEETQTNPIEASSEDVAPTQSESSAETPRYETASSEGFRETRYRDRREGRDFHGRRDGRQGRGPRRFENRDSSRSDKPQYDKFAPTNSTQQTKAPKSFWSKVLSFLGIKKTQEKKPEFSRGDRPYHSGRRDGRRDYQNREGGRSGGDFRRSRGGRRHSRGGDFRRRRDGESQ